MAIKSPKLFYSIFGSVIALIFGAIVAGLILRPVWQVSYAISAPNSRTIEVLPHQELKYTHHLDVESVDALLVNSSEKTTPVIRLEISQAGKHLFAFEGFPELVHPDTDIRLAQHDTEISFGPMWWRIPLPDLQFEHAQPITFSLINQSDQIIALPHEIDDAKELNDALILNSQTKKGNVGVAWLKKASIASQFKYHLVTENELLFVIIILIATLLILTGWQWFFNVSSWPYYLLVSLALLYTFPLYSNLDGWGVWDWPEAASYYSVALRNIGAGQIPTWTPLMCGGTPLWHEPQAYWMSPAFVLVSVFGFSFGSRLAISLGVLVGLLGMFRLARHLQVSIPGALLASIIYCMSGFFAVHIAAGQMLWLMIAWIPWVFYFYLRSFHHRANLIWSALAYLLVFFAGRVYITAYLTMALPILTFGMYLTKQVKLKKAIAALALLGLLILGLGAIKILPMFSYLSGLSTSLEESPSLSWHRIPESFLARNIPIPPYEESVSTLSMEHFAYAGPIALLLALLGMFFLFRKQSRVDLLPWILIGGFFLLTAILPLEINPIESLPIFRELHNPGRSLLMVIFSIAILAAFGWDYVSMLIPKKYMDYSWGLLLVCIMFADLSLLAFPAFQHAFSEDSQVFVSNEDFHQVSDHTDNALHVVEAGYGAVSYCSPHARLWHSGAEVLSSADGSYVGEVYVLSHNHSIERWNALGQLVQVDLGDIAGEDTLVVNQKYDKGWRSHDGRPVFAHNGLVAVAIDPSDQGSTLSIKYSPPHLRIGFIITLVTLLLTLGYFLKTFLLSSWQKNR